MGRGSTIWTLVIPVTVSKPQGLGEFEACTMAMVPLAKAHDRSRL